MDFDGEGCPEVTEVCVRTPWEWLRKWRNRESEWQDELDSHVSMSAKWNQLSGLSEEDARMAARRQFGNRLHALEEVRAVHVRRWLDDFLRDTRLAVRSFLRSPTLVVVATASIAIAATIFMAHSFFGRITGRTIRTVTADKLHI